MRKYISAGDNKWYVDVYLDKVGIGVIRGLMENKEMIIYSANKMIEDELAKLDNGTAAMAYDMFLKNGHAVLRYITDYKPNRLVQWMKIKMMESVVNKYYQKENIVQIIESW